MTFAWMEAWSARRTANRDAKLTKTLQEGIVKLGGIDRNARADARDLLQKEGRRCPAAGVVHSIFVTGEDPKTAAQKFHALAPAEKKVAFDAILNAVSTVPASQEQLTGGVANVRREILTIFGARNRHVETTILFLGEIIETLTPEQRTRAIDFLGLTSKQEDFNYRGLAIMELEKLSDPLATMHVAESLRISAQTAINAAKSSRYETILMGGEEQQIQLVHLILDMLKKRMPAQENIIEELRTIVPTFCSDCWPTFVDANEAKVTELVARVIGCARQMMS